MTPCTLHSMLRRLLLALYAVKHTVLRYALFRLQANTGHDLVHDFFDRWDGHASLQRCLRGIGRFLHPTAPVRVGGVELPQPFMLAAGWCKGRGYDNEVQALATVIRDGNLLPGWRILPHLAGPVEFGSYTRWPRQGNQGRTLWRYPTAQGLGNRVGLRNPGIRAVAAFLALHRELLPETWGLNLASSPGVEDPRVLRSELIESLTYLEDARIAPDWLTLNVSCPSNDENADLQQSTEFVRNLLEGVRAAARTSLPVWLKVGPGLTARQYDQILLLAVEYGVKAIVATNTRQEQTAADGFTWGASGGLLKDDARQAVIKLVTLQRMRRAPVDIVACGGIGHGRDLRLLRRLQVKAWQYQSALVYRGLLAATLIYREAHPDTP